VVKEIAFGKDYAQDVAETKFDNLGRVWQQTRPYRFGVETPEWSAVTYDSLNRPIQTNSPDGSVVTRAYNPSSDPPGSSGQPGNTVKVSDPWGRERWARSDALGRLVEVAEPNPGGSGALSGGAMFTTYSYDALGRLLQVNQGAQTRRFQYDSLGRLTHQKLAERDPMLGANGQWVGGGQWSDVFFYDTRSNIIRRVDARGVQTHYNFNDPLNRLLAVNYDKSGTPAHLSPNIPNTPNVSYGYMSSGDKMRAVNILVDQGMGNEQLSYDSEGRLAQVSQTFTGREGYPILTNYLWDSLDRQKESTYPQQYGAGDIRKKVEPTYDIASRIESLKFGGVTYASNPVYNAASQTTSLNVGGQIAETYNYDPKTGLMTGQQVKRGADTLVDLKYNFTLNNDPNNNGAKTCQLTGITDLKNQARNRAYEYDKLGRMIKVKGGVNAFSNPAWHQDYLFDRYGNRGMIGQPAGQGVETVWFDDSLPAGAVAASSGGDSWNWVSSSPAPQSGSVSHISNIADWSNWSPPPYSGNVSHQSAIASGVHQHQYFSSPTPVPVRYGGTLYAYIYLDPNHPPGEVMLQWGTYTDGWEHRAYWGDNLIDYWGTDGTASRRYMGPLPAAGGWVRLEVPASAVALEGKTVGAMAFTLHGGRANWDLAGISGVNVWYEEVWVWNGWEYVIEYITHEDYENYVLVDDSFPAGADSSADGGDSWNWRGANNVDMLHQHYFYNASNTLQVNAGDTLFTWVHLDSANPPSEVMLQWHENGSWEHRAYWGANQIGWGADGTASRRYMGPLPQAGGWVKLEIPASMVGLEGKTVNGMAFTLYGGRAAWDKAGKTSAATSGPPNPVMGLDGFNNLTYTEVNNRIISPGFEYDHAGNQTRAVIDNSGTAQQYRYDCANRLVQVLDGSGNVLATHAYGASNQRLMSVEGGVTKYFAWAEGQINAEYEAWGANGLIWKTSYVYLGGRLLATTSGAGGTETRFHHPGHLGTRMATNTDGTVVTEQWTLPFGNMQTFTSVPGGENPYQNPTLGNPSKKRFTSYDRSEATTLDYAVNRFYSPQQARFTQVDPIGMRAASLDNPQTLNLYAYCGNDPINHVDPDGLFFGGLFKWIGKVFKWVTLVVTAVVAVITIVAAPALIATLGWAKALLTITATVANAVSSWLSAVGKTKAAGIFGIIGAAASFGTSLIEAAQAYANKGLKFAKSLLKVGAKAASLASKALSAAGEKVEAIVLDLASGVADFIADGFESKNKVLKIGKSWAQSFWATVKFLRSTAEKIATLKGADKLTAYLNLAGVVDDVHNFVIGFDGYDPATNEFKGLLKQTPTNLTNRFHLRIWGIHNKATVLGTGFRNMNGIFGRIANCIQNCEKDK
jgi:RHS repeat-associated protein